MNYKAALEYISSLSSYGIVPGLDSISELCRRLKNPQSSLKFVHIAGTNGKGSVLAYVSTVMECAGYRVGRYISPTIFEYRERIQVNRRMISKAALCEGLEIIKKICEEMREDGLAQPTPFEVETALAFWYFREKKCDIVVLETGMGGLLDATNVIDNVITAVIASVSMDHMQFLGDNLRSIASQKAGIIKSGCRVVLMKQKEEVMEVVSEAAAAKGAELIIADSTKASHVKYGINRQSFDYMGYRRLEITLAGEFQVDNAVLAVEVIDSLGSSGFSISEKALREGLRSTVWHGRFTVISKKPLFIIDGAHNADAAQKLASSVEFYFTNRKIIYIMGILRDKEYDKIISATVKYANEIITVTPPDNPRAMTAFELAKEIAGLHPDVTAADSLEEAVEMSMLLAEPEDVIIAFGSLSYLGRLTQIVTGKARQNGKS
ncbi:MAG: bifunctional folylpolyglutamate synthase/dihydrofolate synthase [Lachnospiraceae bacterium]|nr:bifunctional folylpolyglutamate synthase/dihydrofolate synthase [Lachnospiraceae bacterium]